MHPPDPFAHRYTKLRLVGRGGFGTVYRASDTEMEREVALKLLNPDLAADPDWRKRFRQEATAASKLNHPNITIVFDRGEYQDQPFIVMELVEGETLSKTIEHGLSLSDPERIALLEQLCDGLHYAHQRDIVHRDIKPVNLIVREDDDGTHKARTLKILDFGIAKVVNSGHTATGGMMFTPNYVSPEQVLGEEIDRRGDIFAVGAVAYELLVLQKAFVITSKNPFTILEEVKRKIVEEPHRPMTSVRPDIDPELSAIVDRALAKSPADRYRDLAEMRRRLRKVRERLEEATAVTSETTVIIPPKTQAAIRLARQALEAGDPTGAVTHLEQAITGATSDADRRFLELPLQQARERLAAIRAERKAHDEAAARAAISMATAAFVEGDRTAALRALGEFEPPNLVARELALFTEAAAAIASAERTIEEGGPDARAAALVQLESLAPADLIDPALIRLRQRVEVRLAAEQQAADEAMVEARADFIAGQREEAITALESFTPAALVAAALSELRDAKARIDYATRAVTERGAEERQRALAVLEAFWPAELVSGILLDLQARAAAREAAERREEEEAAASAAAASAVALFVSGSRDQAIAGLAAFPDPPKVAATLERLRQAGRAIDLAEAAVREGGRDDRARALAELESVGHGDLIGRSLESLRALDASRRRAEDHDADAAEAVRLARAQFEAGSRSTAIERLEGFHPAHRLVQDALDQLRAKTTELDQAEQRIRDAQEQSRWEDAAAEAVRLARDAFSGGRRGEAVAMLQGFARPDLVAAALAELRELGARIDATADLVATGAPEERRRALADLASAEPAALFARALAELRKVAAERSAAEKRHADETRARDELASRTRAVQTQARETFVAGSRDRALAMLEAFRPPEPVAALLASLRGAASAIASARTEVQAVAATRLSRRAALDRLAHLEPRELYARAIADLTTIDDQRTAEEARAEAERRARDEQEKQGQLRIQADETAAAATRQFIEGAYDAAVRRLTEFQPAALVGESAAVLRRAKAAIERAAAAFPAGDAAARVRIIEELRAFQPADLVALALGQFQDDHIRRCEDEQRAEVARQARDRAERAARKARQLFDAGQAAAAVALLEAEPAHASVTELLAYLRLQVRIRETIGRAEEKLQAGLLDEAAAAIREARRLGPEDQRARALAGEIAGLLRAARMASLRRLVVRFVGPALLIALSLAGGSWLLSARKSATPEVSHQSNTQRNLPPSPGPTEHPPVAAAPTSVSLDAIPWARFTLTPVQPTSAQAVVTGETPVTLELLPGEYVVELENGNLTPPLTQRISVLDAPVRRVFQMPGFAADRAVTALLGPKR